MEEATEDSDNLPNSYFEFADSEVHTMEEEKTMTNNVEVCKCAPQKKEQTTLIYIGGYSTQKKGQHQIKTGDSS